MVAKARNKKTKKDLLALAEKKMFAGMELLLEQMRTGVNSAIEANSQEVARWLQATSQVLDHHIDRNNAIVSLLVEKEIITEEEFVEQIKKEEATRILLIERAVARKQAEAEAQKQLAEEEAKQMTEEEMVLDAHSEAPSTGPQGEYPDEMEVFGG